MTTISHDLMAVPLDGAFSRAIHDTIQRYRPQHLLEVGTYLGLGSTYAICRALMYLSLDISQFVSIECNPSHHQLATKNLKCAGFMPRLLCGLSLPRRLIPDRDAIRAATMGEMPAGVYVDHPPEHRVERYFRETDYPDAVDDLLGRVMREWKGRADFVLLDGGGHLGAIEFHYFLLLLESPCIIALDDTRHIKNFASLDFMRANPDRFEILGMGDEKFGWAVARYTGVPQ